MGFASFQKFIEQQRGENLFEVRTLHKSKVEQTATVIDKFSRQTERADYAVHCSIFGVFSKDVNEIELTAFEPTWERHTSQQRTVNLSDRSCRL